MAQPFTCLCGTPTCRGRIAGARDMTPAQLEGLWLNRHIRDLLEERDAAAAAATQKVNGQKGAAAAAEAGGYGTANSASADVPIGAQRRGPTSRELSGEMGGDTSV